MLRRLTWQLSQSIPERLAPPLPHEHQTTRSVTCRGPRHTLYSCGKLAGGRRRWVVASESKSARKKQMLRWPEMRGCSGGCCDPKPMRCGGLSRTNGWMDSTAQDRHLLRGKGLDHESAMGQSMSTGVQYSLPLLPIHTLSFGRQEYSVT